MKLKGVFNFQLRNCSEVIIDITNDTFKLWTAIILAPPLVYSSLTM